MIRAGGMAIFAIVTVGCLGSFPADPTGGTSAGTSGGAAGSSNGGAGGSSNGAGGGTSPASDLGAPVDAATASGDLAGAPAADMASACIKLTSPLTDGHHNAGQACLGCHDGNGATLFTAAGTLYDAATNGSTIAGATIELVDAKGTTVRIVTSSNGNFYTSATLTPPFTTRASGCPNDVPMTAKASGDCNSSGCHTSAMRVHLP